MIIKERGKFSTQSIFVLEKLKNMYNRLLALGLEIVN